ncbi:DUF3299 domain-containing protein [Hylemonella sp. W303a]|uniref:DUF3299 domain-containing protein n=1 Tax=Hylemonella sp. W303a TaxID=3389873 RepID=UPI00396B0DDA
MPMKSGGFKFIPAILALAVLVLLPIGTRKLMGVRNFSDDNKADNAAASDPVFREVAWRELAPENWNPDTVLKQVRQGTPSLDDNDPRTRERMQLMNMLWANAPTNARMDEVSVRLSGYVVPLEKNEVGITEFLLVPYFGACIHTPPPPANQIVRIVARPAVRDLRTMDPVRVSGVLRVERNNSELGHSGYAMVAARVEPYTP